LESQSSSFSESSGIDLGWNEGSWDSVLEVVLEIVGARSLGLAFESGSDLADQLVKLGLDLRWGKCLWVLLGKIIAQAELELELDFANNADLNAAIMLISWCW